MKFCGLSFTSSDSLDVSRITRGGIELQKEDLDLREVIRGAVEALMPVLEERKAQLRLDLPALELPVRGDAARMQQVVVNLLSNAARYSPVGSPVVLSGSIDGDSIVWKVKDHGRGISPSMLSDIFEMFVQDEQGLERSTGGLGIDLTLVRQIVELHGGKVQARSEGIGKGSEFTVTLPRQPHAVIHRQFEEQQGLGARRVLIVEDQDDAREVLPQFQVLLTPEDAEIVRLTQTLAERISMFLDRRGLGADSDPQESDSLCRDDPWLAGLYAAAVSGRTAYGPNAGRRVTRVGDEIDPESMDFTFSPRCAVVAGFSLHAHERLRMQAQA